MEGGTKKLFICGLVITLIIAIYIIWLASRLGCIIGYYETKDLETFICLDPILCGFLKDILEIFIYLAISLYNFLKEVSKNAIISAFATGIAAWWVYFFSEIRNSLVGKKKLEQFEKGMKFYKEKEYSDALKLWLLLAKEGYAEAQCQIGYMYEEGIGVVRDYKEAFYWYEKGATIAWYKKLIGAKGHAQSQANLGYLYRKELGVERNDKKALELYKKAAEQGNVNGQNNLGFMYERGHGGIDINYKEALKWYKKAAGQAHASAQNNIGYMYSKGLGIGKDDKEAVRWYRQSAKNGYETGQYNLARVYEEGEGLEQSNLHAYKWFYIADKNGDEYAQGKLDELTGMTKDEIAKAIELAEKCIKSNYKDCGDPIE